MGVISKWERRHPPHRVLTALLLLFLGPSFVEGGAPICQRKQVVATSNGSDGAMGSQYTEVVIANTSAAACRLNMRALRFEQFDPKGHRLPITVEAGAAVNMYGAGLPETVVEPKQRIAFTIRTTNRTGYDESRDCATQMHLTLFNRPLLNLRTISCDKNVAVTGFHSVSPR